MYQARVEVSGGYQSHLAGGSSHVHPSGGQTSLDSLLGKWAQPGAPGGPAASPLGLAINFAFCGVRLELAPAPICWASY